ATRSRSTSASTSAPTSPRATIAAWSRTTCSIWSTPTSRSTPRAGWRWPARPSATSPRAGASPSWWAAPGSTTACSRRGGLWAPPPDAAIRERHRALAAEIGIEALHDRLAAVDPEAAAAISRRDLVRISRALEVHEQTGEPITALRRRAPAPDDLDPVALVLD